MGSKADHLASARGNETLADLVVGIDHPLAYSWAVVMLFYSALHIVDARATQLSYLQHPGNHRIRNDLVRTEVDFRRISKDYFDLFNRGWDARYEFLRFGRQTYTQLRDVSLANIKRELM